MNQHTAYAYYPYPYGYAQPTYTPQQPVFPAPGTGGYQSYPPASIQPIYYGQPSLPFQQPPLMYGNEQKKQHLFHNPLQPQDAYSGGSYPPHMMQAKFPKAPTAKPLKAPGNSLLNSFKSQDGSLDINKMFGTANQMMNAFSQVSSLAKGLTGMFKA